MLFCLVEPSKHNASSESTDYTALNSATHSNSSSVVQFLCLALSRWILG